MPGTWLFGAWWWNFFAWNGSCKLVFLTKGAEIVNALGSDKDWHLTSRNKSLYCHRVMSSLIIAKVSRDFNECLHSNWLNKCTENQIFLRSSFFSNFVICVSLLINRMSTSESNVYHKLLLLISQEIGKGSYVI